MTLTHSMCLLLDLRKEKLRHLDGNREHVSPEKESRRNVLRKHAYSANEAREIAFVRTEILRSNINKTDGNAAVAHRHTQEVENAVNEIRGTDYRGVQEVA